MIVPGTTITVSLVLGYIDIRDKGIVLKKIKVKNRSFDEVVNDLTLFFKARGKLLAPGIIEETLTRIGVPRAKSILIGPPETKEPDQSKTSHSPIDKSTPLPKAEIKRLRNPPESESLPIAIKLSEVSEQAPSIPDAAEELVIQSTIAKPVISSNPQKDAEISESTESQVSSSKDVFMTEGPDGVDISGIKFLSGNDFSDIMDALRVIESIGDEFVPPSDSPSAKSERPHIRVTVSGAEELRASQKTYAAEFGRNITTESFPAPDTEQPLIETNPSVKQTSPSSELENVSKHIIKPIITAKAIILGEEGVGKKSLLEKAKMGHPYSDGIELSHVYENIYELATHRVHLQSWCFDDAAKANVSRNQFYEGTGVVIIVYSVMDRWSFDSVDFWVKEASNSLGYTPPIVLVGNKVDLRAMDSDVQERPVSSEEGYKLAENIANRFGSDGNLHQVGFVETSCLSGAGVDSVFVTAAKLWLMTHTT